MMNGAYVMLFWGAVFWMLCILLFAAIQFIP